MNCSNHDPIFKFLDEIEDLLVYARHKQVRFEFIDPVAYDQWLADGYPAVVTNSIVLYDIPYGSLTRMPDSWCGCYYHPYVLTDMPTIKNFNCFMNRMDPFRQSWLYQFVRQGLFDQGYISFNCDTTHVPWYQGYTVQQAFQEQFDQHLTTFQIEHDWIKDKIPYRNFPDNGDITSICYASKVSVILETYFADNNIITYSEKTFRALQIPRPWLLFSHKHAVKNLRAIGFDLLDDVIDHDSYDAIDSSVERQMCILDLLPSVIELDITYTRLKQAAHHNQSLLKNFSKTWLEDLKNAIDDAAGKT